MSLELLQSILLKRSCPHGMKAMMHLLIEFSITGHSHCPEAPAGSSEGVSDGLIVDYSNGIDA
jgi:hypothetical protein